MFTSVWVTAEEFRAELGICRTTQWKLLKNGYLRPAVHFYRAGIGKKAPLRFNLPACLLALQIYTQK